MKKTILITSAVTLAAALFITSCKTKDVISSPENDEFIQSNKGPDNQRPQNGKMPGGQPPEGKPGQMPPDGMGGPGGAGGPGGPGGMGKPFSAQTYNAECSDENAKSITYTFKNAEGVTVTYHAKYLIDGENKTFTASDFENGTVTVDSENEIAFLVINGGSLTLNGVTVLKKGDGDEHKLGGDAYNFYGINDAIVAVGKNTKAVLKDLTIQTDAIHGNAVFATDSAEIEIQNGIIIKNSRRGSRGLFASYNASVKCLDGNVNISTQGNNSAALATDRGGGSIVLLGKNNNLKTSANDSPCIYSTGSITVAGVNGKSESAQTIVVEGLNNVKVSDSTFTGARQGQGCIMIYQSFSGDSSEGDGNVELKNCTFINQFADKQEAMFYVTNTNAIVTVDNCNFCSGSESTSYSSKDVFILCEENDSQHWGRTGSNGGTITLTASEMNLEGILQAEEKDSSIKVICKDSKLVKGDNCQGQVSVNEKVL